jgi:hypothetical protein
MSIFIPRGGVQFHYNLASEESKARAALANVCIKIPYKGYEISISCDDSAGCCKDLVRSDIRVYKEDTGADVTFEVMKNGSVYADAMSLKRAMRNIDKLVK